MSEDIHSPVKKKEPRLPHAKPQTRRKPWAVWLLLCDGSPWNFGVYAGIVEAWGIARTLAGNERRVRSLMFSRFVAFMNIRDF